MTDEIENEEEKMDAAARWYYSEIMRQLLDSDRFVNWFQLNYDIHKLIDEEAKSIDIRVIEVPPHLVQERMMENMAQHAQAESPIVQASAKDLVNIKKRREKK
jgi:hypothetical protein